MQTVLEWVQEHVGEDQATTLEAFYQKMTERKAPDTPMGGTWIWNESSYDIILLEDDQNRSCTFLEVSELVEKIGRPPETKCWFNLPAPMNCLENLWFEMRFEGMTGFYEIQIF